MRDLEANNLDGQKALDAILAFFVHVTKEFRWFHVLLCSSDNFVHATPLRMINSILDTCLKIKLQNTGGMKLEFEEAYDVCRGNMFLLYKTYNDYTITGVRPNASSYLHYAKMGLLRATEPNNPFIHNSWKSPPSWTKNQVLEVIDKIGKSVQLYVLYVSL